MSGYRIGPSGKPNEAAMVFNVTGGTVGRMCRFTAPLVVGLPSAGGSVDGVVQTPPPWYWPSVLPAFHGSVLQVETGGNFSQGDDLKTDSSGRVVAQGGSGTVVARALESSAGSGHTVWVVFQ